MAQGGRGRAQGRHRPLALPGLPARCHRSAGRGALIGPSVLLLGCLELSGPLARLGSRHRDPSVLLRLRLTRLALAVGLRTGRKQRAALWAVLGEKQGRSIKRCRRIRHGVGFGMLALCRRRVEVICSRPTGRCAMRPAPPPALASAVSCVRGCLSAPFTGARVICPRLRRRASHLSAPSPARIRVSKWASWACRAASSPTAPYRNAA